MFAIRTLFGKAVPGAAKDAAKDATVVTVGTAATYWVDSLFNKFSAQKPDNFFENRGLTKPEKEFSRMDQKP